MLHSASVAVTAVEVAAVAFTAAVVVVAFTAAVEAAGSMAVAAAVVFIAGAVEDSTAVALPVAVAGFMWRGRISWWRLLRGAVAARDRLAEEAITGAEVFVADRQPHEQAGVPTAGSVPRAA